ncbi:MAG: aminotransferase class I/II-fold pyridoxal phosphate-dependent enzyme [Gemmatimonadetes bacterium]|nr:aminotransferase class I/II-fold pyridoxal phosphate-dependent enzyme [Gemmatimonadota bacterium]
MRGRSAVHGVAGARWCRELKLEVPPERIVVAGGAQQALLGLVALLCQPGDAILTAQLTYPGLLAIARKAHVRVVGVAQDDEGVLPEAVDQACRRAKPRFLYLVPTFQNPTTATASAARRAAIAEVVRRRGITLIEDDGHAALLSPGLAPVSALVPERAFYVAGLSKAVSPGLRTAYVATPPGAAQALNDTLFGLGLFPAPIAVSLKRRGDHAGAWRRGPRRRCGVRRRCAGSWRVAPARAGQGGADQSFRVAAAAGAVGERCVRGAGAGGGGGGDAGVGVRGRRGGDEERGAGVPGGGRIPCGAHPGARGTGRRTQRRRGRDPGLLLTRDAAATGRSRMQAGPVAYCTVKLACIPMARCGGNESASRKPQIIM